MKKLTAALILITTPAIAESPCDYTKKVQTSWTHHIEKTSNIKKNVFQYVENTRKCMMTMDVTINGVVYPASGDYVFGPDMTENYACEQAIIKAKKEAIGIVSSEILTAQTNMSCVQNRPVEKKAIQRVISRSAESLPRSSSSVFVEETPATGLRINLGFQTNIGNILGAFIK